MVLVLLHFLLGVLQLEQDTMFQALTTLQVAVLVVLMHQVAEVYTQHALRVVEDLILQLHPMLMV